MRLLGPFDVLVDGSPVELGGAKLRLLLTMLGLHAGRVVSVDVLAEELWGPSPDVDVAAGLQALASRARRALAGGTATLSARNGGYQLDGVDVDAEQFARHVERGAARVAGDPLGAADEYRAALALWRGRALDPFADSEFARLDAARLTEARATSVEALTEALLSAGREGEAVAVLEPHVVAEPFREAAVAALMLALYRAGRRADALETYRRVRSRIADELGLEPGTALRRRHEEVLAESPALDPPTTPAPAGVPNEALRAFLFTDIEASARRWEHERAAMAVDLARHDALLREAVAAARGTPVSHTGDGLCAQFPTAGAALTAAATAQRALGAEVWRGDTPLRARMAVHVGAAQERDGNWFGPALNRAARLMGLARGGQVLCSGPTADLSRDALPEGVRLVDLGERALAGLDRPERVFELVAAGASAGSLAPPAAAPQGLPRMPGESVGRESELADLAALLHKRSLPTLWGPDGAGKTRLSLELARRSAAEFADGVWFVDLAPVGTLDQVAPAAMAALGMLGAAQDAVGALVRHLTGRQALLVLDNCEHVIEAAAALADAVLVP